MKTMACTLLAAVFACLSVRANDAIDTSDTQFLGFRQQMFREIGPRRGILVGFDVYIGTWFNNDVVHGIRPIFLDAQGREQVGTLHGIDTGHAPIHAKAKKGYAIGAIEVKSGTGIDGFSVTFMKLQKGRLDPDQSYDSEWLGGRGGGGPVRLGGSGDPVVGLFGSQNTDSQLNGLGLILSNKPIVAPAERKLPLPDDAAKVKALKLAKEVYGEEWAAAKTSSQKRDLAQKFLHGADESQNDTVGLYILLKLARDIATQATDGQLAFEAIDRMAEKFDVDDLDMKFTVLTTFSKRAKSMADHKALGDQAAGLIEAAIARDNVDLAQKLCELALPEARASRDADLVHEVNARIEQCKALGKAYREMKEAAVILDKKPDDPLANLTVGKYYCFQKGNWEKGLPMLALGQDETLKALATQEIAGVTKPDDQVKVGDAWWDQADKEHGKIQAILRGRANYWYQQALPEQSGLARARLEKRIKEFEAAAEGGEENKAESSAAKRAGKYLPGLVAQYYNDSAFTQRINSRIDGNIDFIWTNNPPMPGMNAQNFSVRWLGYVKAPKAGRYILRVRSHFDCQVMIDSNLLIANQVTGRIASDQRATVTLTAGYHLLAAQFVHGGFGQATIHVGWQQPGEPSSTAISEENLFHDQRQEQAAGLRGR